MPDRHIPAGGQYSGLLQVVGTRGPRTLPCCFHAACRGEGGALSGGVLKALHILYIILYAPHCLNKTWYFQCYS